jgi:hypothetical protein
VYSLVRTSSCTRSTPAASRSCSRG